MTKTHKNKKKSKSDIKPRLAEVLREYGPFPGKDDIGGVTFDGTQVWFASGKSIVALDPKSGALVREVAVAADAGTAFDGKYLWQIADDRIQKVDPKSGKVVATIAAPAQGRDSGLTWAEGTLWVGEYRARKIHQIDAKTGALLRTIESDRFVTGVSWVNGELWHGTIENDESEIRHINPETGEVLERLEMPAGTRVSGLECDGAGVFYCGGGSSSGKVRAVRKPKH
jgi:glutamine cyclotransferase